MNTILLLTKTDYEKWIKECRSYYLDFDPMLMKSDLPVWVVYCKTDPNGLPYIEYESFTIYEMERMLSGMKEPRASEKQ